MRANGTWLRVSTCALTLVVASTAHGQSDFYESLSGLAKQSTSIASGGSPVLDESTAPLTGSLGTLTREALLGQESPATRPVTLTRTVNTASSSSLQRRSVRRNDPWSTRAFGDLFGIRSCLADLGIYTQSSITGFYQGVTSGGNNRVFRSGAKYDQFFILDSEKLGLWDGAKLVIHSETAWGQNAVADAVGLAPVNSAFLTPRVTNDDFGLTNVQLLQQLGAGWAFTMGKINMADLWEQLYPDYGRGLDGFMNTSLLLPLNIVPTVPLVFNGAGVMKAGDHGVELGFLVADSRNTATTVGLSDIFEDGATLIGLARRFTEWGGRPGSHMFAATYGTGDYTSLDSRGWVIQPGVGVVAPESTGSWMAAYILNQTLWSDRCDPDRSVELTSAWGISDTETSPFGWSGNLTVEAFGVIDGRENDRMGVGYFYSGLSSDFKDLFAVVGLQDVHGAELYYNAEISDCFHLTTDLQILQPSDRSNDTAVVLGFRGRLDL